MSSTDRRRTEALTRFYEGYILPLSRTNGMEVLDHSPPRAALSYFIKRTRTRMTRADFEVKLGDDRQLAQTLESQWSGTPLRGLGKPIIKLVRRLPETEEQREMSASIYEMF